MGEVLPEIFFEHIHLGFESVDSVLQFLVTASVKKVVGGVKLVTSPNFQTTAELGRSTIQPTRGHGLRAAIHH
jgi:hypothetical protein